MKKLRIVDSGYFKYKFVSGIDFGTTDLLSWFPEVTAFIDGGVKSGAVLHRFITDGYYVGHAKFM
jgi:hypothetical protein